MSSYKWREDKNKEQTSSCWENIWPIKPHAINLQSFFPEQQQQQQQQQPFNGRWSGTTQLITSLGTPIKSFLQIHKTKIELFTFNSKILLHLSFQNKRKKKENQRSAMFFSLLFYVFAFLFNMYRLLFTVIS